MIITIVYASVSCLVAILFLAFYREQYKRLDLDDDKEKHLGQLEGSEPMMSIGPLHNTNSIICFCTHTCIALLLFC